MRKWTERQIKELLEKAANGNRSHVFAEIAHVTGRKPNSVRNFYYKLVGEDQKKSVEAFTDFETERLLRAIILGISKGESVRSICMSHANGDMGGMLRFQNKYRATLLKAPECIERTVRTLEGEGYFVKSPLDIPAKIISMPATKETHLSDSDIQNLFMGLVRLVRNNSETQVEKLRAEIERLKTEFAVKHTQR